MNRQATKTCTDSPWSINKLCCETAKLPQLIYKKVIGVRIITCMDFKKAGKTQIKKCRLIKTKKHTLWTTLFAKCTYLASWWIHCKDVTTTPDNRTQSHECKSTPIQQDSLNLCWQLSKCFQNLKKKILLLGY